MTQPMIGDPVRFRRHPAEHYQRGRVLGRTYGTDPVRFDVETSDGERFDNMTDVELDEMALARLRESELAPILGDAA